MLRRGSGQHPVVEIADPRHGGAVDEIVDLGQCHRRARLERALEARGATWLDEADRRPRRRGAQDLHAARREPAAAHGQHHDVGRNPLGQLREDLACTARLALDDIGIVERRQEDRARLCAEILCRLQRVVEIVAHQPDLDLSAAELPRLVDLLLRRRHRHEDHALGAEMMAGIGHALCMVAGRGADETPPVGLRRQSLAHRIEGAPDLVGAHRREVFALEPDIGTVSRRKIGVALERRRIEQHPQGRGCAVDRAEEIGGCVCHSARYHAARRNASVKLGHFGRPPGPPPPARPMQSIVREFRSCRSL